MKGKIARMSKELEIVSYPHIKYCKVFMLSMNYRTPHMHRDFELILQLEGSLEIKLERENYITHSPSLMLFNTNHIHEISLRSERSVLLVLQISPLFFSAIYPSLSKLIFDSVILHETLGEEDFNAILKLFIELGRQYFRKENLYEFSFAITLCDLFSRLIRLLPHHTLSEDQKKAEELKAGRLNRILSYIDENYSSKILLKDIAALENLSLYYLSHFFKKNINQNFQEYVNTLRFNQAKRLLIENKDMSMLDVCFQSGYSDYRYLQKAFAERLGCTPAEYRRNSSAVDSDLTMSGSGSLSERWWHADDSLKYLDDWVNANKDRLDMG